MAEKQCFKCECVKPLDEFYTHPKMADGHLGKCKQCTCADARENRSAKVDYYQAYEHRRARSARGQERASTNRKAMRAKYPGKYRARMALGNAVTRGLVVPWPVCAVPECTLKPEGHHPDYSRPLDVVWLCPSHHRQAHALVSAPQPRTAKRFLRAHTS